MTAACEPDSNRGKKGRVRPYAWLAAGALSLGVAAAVGTGTAHAEAGSSTSASEAGAGLGGPSNHSALGGPGRGVREALNMTKAASAVASVDAQRRPLKVPRGVLTAGSSSASKTVTASNPCGTQSGCGSATFSYTGSPQTWTAPAGVNTAYVTVVGGQGGAFSTAASWVVPISATLPLNVTAVNYQLSLVVGGAGVTNTSNGSKSGAVGGYNGGGAGGSGSNSGLGGSGGGGATAVSLVSGGSSQTVLVGGGSGGSGGWRTGDGGAGGVGGQGPASNGVWAGGSGLAGETDNGGGGGAGSNQLTETGANGGDAETLSGNAGGGGGGGGWRGGSGGQPGQADIGPFSTAGAGGGGGGGSSYADPALTSNVSIGGVSYGNGSATIQWVDIVTTSLKPMRVGRQTSQQLSAVYGDNWASSLNWQVSGGSLPLGLSLSPDGRLTGAPKQSQIYAFQVTVNSDGLASSVITYTGAVCSRRCARQG